MEATLKNDAAAAIERLPSDLQDHVRQWFERLEEQHGAVALTNERTESLLRIVACSEFAGAVLLKEWQWFAEHADDFSEATDLETEFGNTSFADDVELLKSELRRFRNRYLLRILWREVFALADLDETLQQLSLLADLMLDVAARHAERSLRARYGRLRDDEGKVVPQIILGMGKLGGRELNFSSDIDLNFLDPHEGKTDGSRTVTAHEYFARQTRHISALIDERTVD